jgi:hypothetical protein
VIRTSLHARCVAALGLGHRPYPRLSGGSESAIASAATQRLIMSAGSICGWPLFRAPRSSATESDGQRGIRHCGSPPQGPNSTARSKGRMPEDNEPGVSRGYPRSRAVGVLSGCPVCRPRPERAATVPRFRPDGADGRITGLAASVGFRLRAMISRQSHVTRYVPSSASFAVPRPAGSPRAPASSGRSAPGRDADRRSRPSGRPSPT